MLKAEVELPVDPPISILQLYLYDNTELILDQIHKKLLYIDFDSEVSIISLKDLLDDR